MWDPSGHDSYVIYDKNAKAGTTGKMFKDEAKIVQKRLKKKYKKPCHLIMYNTAKDFKKFWNISVGYRISPYWNKTKHNICFTKKKVKIQEIYIISHGSIEGDKGQATGYMYCFDKTRIYARKTNEYDAEKDVLVSDLMRKKITKLTFSCCNTANPDCYNIANAFIRQMSVKKVIGFDGGARFDYDDQKLKKGFDVNQETWRKYVKTKPLSTMKAVNGSAISVETPIRKRMGKRTYSYGRWSAIDYY